ncbi:MAG TPA: hypothetical protein VH678_20485 [Xanthobacteraceae bacterium]
MNDEDKLERAIFRGVRAEALLNDELLQESFATLDANYVQAWRTAPVRDVEMREKLWQAVNIVGKVKEHLTKIVNDGKLAQADLSMRTAKAGSQK